jgi:AraC family transcriptional regulator of adaptative response/methylated-DNA-[protein]-cysteine methyltransferase
LRITSSKRRTSGASPAIHFAIDECSLGSILVAASNRGICAVLLGGDPDSLARDLHKQFPHATPVGNDRAFEEILGKVVALVEAPAVGVDLPLDLRGTAFQQRVWRALRKVPMGSTVTYADIARQIGAPQSVRGVAQACMANMLAVAIPCHRVVKKNGDFSGYRWGADRQRTLLDREAGRPGRVDALGPLF